MPAVDQLAVADHTAQAREFLAKARKCLAEDDLHQASEKGWGAAARMAKAVAETHGWRYARHADFSVVMNHARKMTGNNRLSVLRAVANDLHSNYYRRKRFLDAEVISEDLECVAELVEILAPLTLPTRD